MAIIEKLASSLGAANDLPNQELAKQIAQSSDHSSVAELVGLLKNSKDKAIQSDCIKILYEAGYLAPELIASHYQFFGGLLRSKNNRLVWGAMIALDSISKVDPDNIFTLLPEIVNYLDIGSVITKDHGIGVLINLSACKKYEATAFPLLMEQLRFCPSKQLPMYAERAIIAINAANKEEFVGLLLLRLPEMESESQRKRIEKVVKKLNK